MIAKVTVGMTMHETHEPAKNEESFCWVVMSATFFQELAT